MAGQVPAVTRVKYEFKLLSLEVHAGDVEKALNALGAVGFAVASQHALAIGASGQSFYLLLARPIGIDVVGAGLIS